MRMLILLIGVLTAIGTFSQGRPGEDHFRIGFEYAQMQRFGTTKTEISENEFLVLKYKSEIPAIGVPVGFRFEIGKRWALGMEAMIGKFLYEDDKNENTEAKNSRWKLGLASEFNILNRPDSRLFVGMLLSRVLSVSTTSTYYPSADARYAYRGNALNCAFGIVKFPPTRKLGFYAAIDFFASRVKFFAYNGDKVDIMVKYNKITLDDLGFGLKAGICLRHFRN